VSFPSPDLLNLVLKDGPWFMNSSSLFFCPWSPNFDLWKEKISKAPLWLSIHALLTDFCKWFVLKLIANSLG
ncbi:hypothetical protein KI387_005545, partial [Taxus chinensis]